MRGEGRGRKRRETIKGGSENEPAETGEDKGDGGEGEGKK